MVLVPKRRVEVGRIDRLIGDATSPPASLSAQWRRFSAIDGRPPEGDSETAL